jgi:hypothetical protein
MDKKQKIIAAIIILLFIGNIIYKNRRVFFDPDLDTEIDKMWADRHKKAEYPLKKFNDEIFSKVAFRGAIVDIDYSRTGSVDIGGSYWMDIKLSAPLVKPDNIPLKIPNIYDLAGNPIRIYYKADCILDGRKVEKKLHENFISIDSHMEESTSCGKIFYTTQFDYFWKKADPIP